MYILFCLENEDIIKYIVPFQYIVKLSYLFIVYSVHYTVFKTLIFIR